jgi:hypothetical protein
LVGIEHEYSLRDASGVVDFRSLLHRLPVAGQRLDPGDPNAYRCAWGGALTCDGTEAEVASPPVTARPGFTNVVESWSRIARSELERLLPADVEATGYSTHLSALLLPRHSTRIARRYARTFGPGLMLLMDRRDSPGLLIRPRPGRLELGGEYVSGDWLRAAVAYVAGSTRAAAEGRFPPAVVGTIEPAIERYGWFVARTAFGDDLYTCGRKTRLRRAIRSPITAQTQLELGWAIARDSLEGVAEAAELQEVDRIVRGDLPLPSELDEPVENPITPAGMCDVPTGKVLERRERPGYTLEPALATWDFTVFSLHGVHRSGYLCVPRAWLGDFFVELGDGLLDDDITRFLARPATARVLASAEQTAEPGLYDRLGAPADLLPQEREPITGRRSGGSSGPGDRRGKRRSERAPRPRGRWLVVAAAVAAVVVIVVGLVLALGGGGSDTTNAASPTTQERTVRGTPRPTNVPVVGAGFSPHGTAAATIEYAQDGAYQVTQAITITPSNVRPGDVVDVSTVTTSAGPNWARPPGGEFTIVCDDTARSSFSPSSSSTLFLSPGTASGPSLVSGIAQGGTPAASLAVTAPLTGGQFRETPEGCNKTATADNHATLTVPPTIRPGTYRLVPAWGLFAELPGQQNALTYASGEYPVLTVVRARSPK